MESQEVSRLKEKYPIIEEWIKNIPPDVSSQCRLLKYRKGETLFCKGDKIKKVYLICEGTVMISSRSINGNEMGIVFVTEGFSVGEMEILLETNDLLYGAKVFSDSILLEIPENIFRMWIDKDSSVCKKLATILAQKLYNASSSTVKNKRLEAITRLEMFISEYGTGKISETREELAEACGVSSRTVNRAISVLADRKMITLKNGKIEVSKKQLEKIDENILEQMDQYK